MRTAVEPQDQLQDLLRHLLYLPHSTLSSLAYLKESHIAQKIEDTRQDYAPAGSQRTVQIEKDDWLSHFKMLPGPRCWDRT